MSSSPPYPTQGNAYYAGEAPPQGSAYFAGQAPPPTYNEAMGGTHTAPPPGFKPPPPTFTQPSSNNVPVFYPRVGPEPMSTQCPNCGVTVETMTRAEPGVIAYISGVLIFLFGLWCGCCLIPCCIDSCMDVHHTCPNCKAYLGRYRR